VRITTTYEQVTHQVKRRVKCDGGCGRTLTRQSTFTATVNPFNKNPDGTVRTYAEVHRNLVAEAERWQPTATCRVCSDWRRLIGGAS
jgi:hypothetical protein